MYRNYRKRKYTFNVKLDQLDLKKLLSGRHLDVLLSFAVVNAGPSQEKAKSYSWPVKEENSETYGRVNENLVLTL
jgi:hypothetical protein